MRALPPIFAACALLAVAGAPPAARAGEPFLIRNDQPVGRLHGVPVGVDADPAAAQAAAAAARAAGVRIFTIGLGGDVDLPFLQELAGDPSQAYAA
ncbi:MAG TPA: hypothetical protein P5204_04080, partial [Kiritimatiellia bacterium]|nr:hypothetical protein [Kiritimatiellia bacterium]